MEYKSHSRESLPALLSEHGISPTHQRIEIAHAILSRCDHVSADRILALANDRYNVDTGELTDIDARAIEVTGLPPLPPGTEAAGVDVIVRVSSAGQAS